MSFIIPKKFDNIPPTQVNVTINFPTDLSQFCSKPLLGSCSWNIIQASPRCILDIESRVAKVSCYETGSRDIAREDDDHDEVSKTLDSLLDFFLINVKLDWGLMEQYRANGFRDQPLDAPIW